MGQKSDFDLIELNGLKTKVINAPECKVLPQSVSIVGWLESPMQLESPWCLVWVLGQHLQYCIELPRHQKKVGLGALIGQSLFEDIHINVCI